MNQVAPSQQDRIDLVSEYDYENDLYYRLHLGRDDYASIRLGFDRDRHYRFLLTRSNFFKIDRLFAALADLLRVASAAPEPFSIHPLASIDRRFLVYRSYLKEWAATSHLLIDFGDGDGLLSDYLSRIAIVANDADDPKELLLAMGAVSDEVFTGPFRVCLDPSTICNVNCLYCRAFSPTINPSGRSQVLSPQFLSFSSLREYLHDAHDLDVRHVSIAGGAEPMAVPYFERLCDLLAELSFKVDISTNGTYLNEGRARKIIDCAAFDSVVFSVSAVDRAGYDLLHPGHGTKWNKIISNMRYLSVCKKNAFVKTPNLVFLFVIVDKNVDSIEAAVELTAELGFDQIWLQMLHSEAWNDNLKVSPRNAARLPEIVDRARQRARQLGLAWPDYIEDQVGGLDTNEGTWSPFIYSQGCYVGWYFSFFGYHRNIYFCCGAKEIDRIFSPGKTFAKIWKDSRYRFLRQHAKYLDDRVNIHCSNDYLLNDSFCASCDNLNFNQEMRRILSDTGLERFLGRDEKERFLDSSPIEIVDVEMIDRIGRIGKSSIYHSGSSIVMAIDYKVRRRVFHAAINIVVLYHSFRIKRLWECFVDLSPQTMEPGLNERIHVRLNGLNLGNDHVIEIQTKAALREGDLVRYYPGETRSNPLIMLADNRLGGGILPQEHLVRLSKIDDEARIDLSDHRIKLIRAWIDGHSIGKEPVLLRGQRTCFSFTYQIRDDLGKAVFRMQLLYDDGKTHLFGANNHRQGLARQIDPGLWTFTVEMKELDLPPGWYRLTVKVSDSEEDHSIVRAHDDFTLRIAAPTDRSGFLDIDHEVLDRPPRVIPFKDEIVRSYRHLRRSLAIQREKNRR